jgi:predicted amidophosphoribosyltransferase
VTKETKTCRACGASLGGIRCTNCGFIGQEGDFPGDLCPKCGRNIRSSIRGGGPAADDSPLMPACEICGKQFRSKEFDSIFVCPGCGYSKPGLVKFYAALAAIFLGAGVVGIFIANMKGRLWLMLPGFTFGFIELCITLARLIRNFRAVRLHRP